MKLDEQFEGVIKLIKLFSLVLYSAHIISCFQNVQAQFFYNQYGLKTWQQSQEFYDDNFFNIWVTGLYFTILAMVSVNHLQNQNSFEKLISIILILISSSIFAYSINTIGNIVKMMNKHEADLKKQLRELNHYMKQRHISSILQTKIRRYLEYLYVEKKKGIYKGIKSLEALSGNLKNELFTDAYEKYLLKVPIIQKNFSPEFVRQLCLSAQEKTYAPQESIIDRNQEKQQYCFYYILSGEVEMNLEFHNNDQIQENKRKSQATLLTKEGEDDYSIIIFEKENSNKQQQNKFNIQTFKKDEFFGMESFFEQREPYYYCKSVKITNIICLSFANFIKALEKFPLDYETYCKIKEDSLIYLKHEQFDQRCGGCLMKSHNILQCPLVTISISKQQIIENTIYKNKQSRFLQKRREIKHNSLQQHKKNFEAFRNLLGINIAQFEIEELEFYGKTLQFSDGELDEQSGTSYQSLNFKNSKIKIVSQETLQKSKKQSAITLALQMAPPFQTFDELNKEQNQGTQNQNQNITDLNQALYQYNASNIYSHIADAGQSIFGSQIGENKSKIKLQLKSQDNQSVKSSSSLSNGEPHKQNSQTSQIKLSPKQLINKQLKKIKVELSQNFRRGSNSLVFSPQLQKQTLALNPNSPIKGKNQISYLQTPINAKTQSFINCYRKSVENVASCITSQSDENIEQIQPSIVVTENNDLENHSLIEQLAMVFFIQPQNLFIIKDEIQFNFIFFQFEKQQCYKNYYPHNNIFAIVQQLNLHKEYKSKHSQLHQQFKQRKQGKIKFQFQNLVNHVLRGFKQKFKQHHLENIKIQQAKNMEKYLLNQQILEKENQKSPIKFNSFDDSQISKNSSQLQEAILQISSEKDLEKCKNKFNSNLNKGFQQKNEEKDNQNQPLNQNFKPIKKSQFQQINEQSNLLKNF